jgi:uncharacterized membrane protein YtjA (UPF0391 family)
LYEHLAWRPPWHGACERDGQRGAPVALNDLTRETAMLHYAIVFFVIALIAALFGFGGIAAGAVEIGKLLFFVFLIIAAVTFVVGLMRKP